jgi:MFS family permease
MALPYGVSIGLMALGFGAAAVAPNVWVAAIVVVAAGAGNGVAVITNAVLVQRGAPDRLRGRAFAVVMSLGYAFLGLGMIVAGPHTNEAGARTVWAAAAGLLGIAAIVGFLLARRVDAEMARIPVRHASGPEPLRD